MLVHSATAAPQSPPAPPSCPWMQVDYFTSFLKLQPRGSIDESIVRFLTPAQDLASNSGIYTFRLVKDGQPTQVTQQGILCACC